MSTIDLIILGLVHDRPTSAYEMQKHIEYRNLSRWVRISTPSIYKKVLRLEEQGYLERKTEREGRMPEKAVYSITPKGLERFEDLMRQGAQAAVEVLFDFNAVVANLNKLPKDQALALVDSLRGGIRESLAYIKEVRPSRVRIPLTGRAVMDQQIRVLETLTDWADGFRVEFEQEGSRPMGAIEESDGSESRTDALGDSRSADGPTS